MSQKEESGECEGRVQLGYRLPFEARNRLEKIIKELPAELDANLSNIQEAIIMAFLKTNPAPKDQITSERLIIMLRRGELK